MSMLLDALGYLGDTLDKPGRAVRGLLSGNSREGLAAVPFSDSFGLTDPNESVSGEQLLGNLGLKTGNEVMDAILGFGANVATDPTTYAGGFLGRAAGRAIGRGLEGAAASRGPGYGTTLGDVLAGTREHALSVAAPPGSSPEAVNFAKQWVEKSDGLPGEMRGMLKGMWDEAPGAFAEFPPGSRVLGSGAEGIAFKTPAGDVLRMGFNPAGTPGRPVSDAVLQATRAADYPMANGIVARAERLPLAQDVGGQAMDIPTVPAWEVMSPTARQQVLAHEANYNTHPHLFRSPGDRLAQRLESQGLEYADAHPKNAGFFDGRPIVIDPGAVEALPQFAGGFSPVTTPGEPSRITRLLLDALGGQPALRSALNAGFAHPEYQRLLGRLGLAGGASLGLS